MKRKLCEVYNWKEDRWYEIIVKIRRFRKPKYIKK
jgi:hypothetical protein